MLAFIGQLAHAFQRFNFEIYNDLELLFHLCSHFILALTKDQMLWFCWIIHFHIFWSMKCQTQGIYSHLVGFLYHCMNGAGGRGGFLEAWPFGAIWFAFKYALSPSFWHGQSLVLKLVAKVLFHYYLPCLPSDNPFL